MAETVTPAAAPVDLSRVRALVRATRSRLRLQGALEGATTGAIVGAAAAAASIFLVRTEVVSEGTGVALLVGAGGIVIAGALRGALGRLDDEAVARRIDRASGLADRLSSAVAFDRAIGQADADADTAELMRAAMRDAVAAAPRANPKAAAPYAAPRDLKPALAFVAIAGILAGLGVVHPPRDPRVTVALPAAAPRGAQVTIEGLRLCGPKAPPERTCEVPSALVYVGDGDAAVAASIDSWTGGGIGITIPAGAHLGVTELVVWARGKRIGAVPFEVTADDDPRNLRPDAVALDPDDEAYLRDLVADVRAAAKRDDVKALEDYAAKVEALLDLADQGKLTKEQLLAELDKAQAELDAGAEKDPEQIAKDLAETGKDLADNPLTKEIGAALAKGDLEKAKAEMEKLADKLDQGALDQKQAEQLAKALEKAAEKYQDKQDAKDKQDQAKRDKVEDEVRKLEKERDQAKDEQARQDAERRLDKKKDELQKLDKDKQEREQSAQREAVERLHKQMKQSAEDLQRKPEQGDQQDQQQQNQDNQKQASRSMRDVADETGKVDQDQRKQAAQKKMASQMDDLREAMRRAKQRGNKGPQNPFGKNSQKQQDFARRAAGGQGQKGAWKPGQGQGQGQQGQGQQGQGQQGQQGQGQGQNGGQGQQGDPSSNYGDGHDEHLVGDATPMSGNTTDESVSGVHGRKGPSTRETILAAAQKGYASTAYRAVYAKYKDIVEDAMKSEKVPASYKYYVKKYFTKIKPHAMD